MGRWVRSEARRELTLAEVNRVDVGIEPRAAQRQPPRDLKQLRFVEVNRSSQGEKRRSIDRLRRGGFDQRPFFERYPLMVFDDPRFVGRTPSMLLSERRLIEGTSLMLFNERRWVEGTSLMLFNERGCVEGTSLMLSTGCG